MAAAILAIGAIGVVLGGAYYINSRPEIVSAGSREPPNLDLLKPARTRFLLENEPAPVLWLPQSPQARFTHNAEQRQLTVTCPVEEDGLFHLGTVTSGNFELQVRLFQVSWDMGVGVYFGYHRVDRPVPNGKDLILAEMQMIYLGREVKNVETLPDLHIIRGRSIGAGLTIANMFSFKASRLNGLTKFTTNAP